MHKIITCIFSFSVVGITISKLPDRAVVLGSQNPVHTTFLCQLPSSPAIGTIYNMKILRKRDSDTEESAIAEVKNNAPKNTTILDSDVKSRANVSLGIDTSTPTSSQLKLEFVTQKIKCTDVGSYKCSVTYDNAAGVTQTDEDNTTLSVYGMFVLCCIVGKKAFMDGDWHGGCYLFIQKKSICNTVQDVLTSK